VLLLAASRTAVVRAGEVGARTQVGLLPGPKKREMLYAKSCILGNMCTIIGPQNGPFLLC